MPTCNETITYKGFSLEIRFYYDKGYAGSQTEPPEPPVIEIEDVWLLNYKNKQNVEIAISICDLLTTETFKEIEEILWNIEHRRYDR